MRFASLLFMPLLNKCFVAHIKYSLYFHLIKFVNISFTHTWFFTIQNVSSSLQPPSNQKLNIGIALITLLVSPCREKWPNFSTLSHGITIDTLYSITASDLPALKYCKKRGNYSSLHSVKDCKLHIYLPFDYFNISSNEI